MALKCILASMDGMTTAAFRSICFEYGAAGATTEMIPAIGYARAKKKSKPIMDALVLRRPEERGELAAQIIGNKPALMAEAARKLEALGRGQIVDGVGRGIALDRDGNYAKIQKAYEAMVLGAGVQYHE